jgi:hypothetical protein
MAFGIEAAKNTSVISQVNRPFWGSTPDLKGTEQLRRSGEFQNGSRSTRFGPNGGG